MSMQNTVSAAMTSLRTVCHVTKRHHLNGGGVSELA
jgi:hypothetical protein